MLSFPASKFSNKFLRKAKKYHLSAEETNKGAMKRELDIKRPLCFGGIMGT